MKTILVVANETIGGAKLHERVKAKVAEADGDARVVLCVPRSFPRHGNIIYDDFVFQAAQVRVDLARGFLRGEGINAIGEVGDPDPFSAAMDAVDEHDPDEIIISTYPATTSGWLRRDLIHKVEQASRLPVEHVIVDIDAEGVPFEITLLVANKTASGDAVIAKLKEKPADLEHRIVIVVIPQEGGDGLAARKAHARLAQVLDRLRNEGFVAAGMIGDPDPYTATMNALEVFNVHDVVISTLAATRSGWLRADLVERVRSASGKPVEHVEASAPAAA